MTAEYSPGVYTGRPDDISTVKLELLLKENEGFQASYVDKPDESKALTAGGECAQRIGDMPRVGELIARITEQAQEILEKSKKTSEGEPATSVGRTRYVPVPQGEASP